MKRLILLATLTFPATGCAQGLEQTVNVVEKGAAGVKVVVDESVNIWSAGVEAQVAFCKAKGLGEDASEEDRAKCMGLLARGDKADPGLDKLRQGYDMLAEAIEMLREGSEDLAPFLEAAQEAIKK